MNYKNYLRSVMIIALFAGCNNSDKKNKEYAKIIDYSKKSTLDSLIQATPSSHDSMFLGFTAGMSKLDYESHIKNMRAEGKNITFSNSNVISTATGRFELGPLYTFKTNILLERGGKTITGKGEYFLQPRFNENGNLVHLSILPIEKWANADRMDNPKWLVKNIKDNSRAINDKNLKKSLIEKKIVSEYDFIGKKGNLFIYESYLTINYIDFKTLYIDMSLKLEENERTKDQIKDMKF
jgi:hypothetical protein